MTISEMISAGWRMKRDPSDGLLYGAYDTKGAGICYVTPPQGNETAPLCGWVHPSWLTPAEFEALPEAKP